MVTSTIQKNKVLHTSNLFDKIFVKYETPEGEIKNLEQGVDWYFAVKKVDEEKARTELGKTLASVTWEDDPKFPEYVKIHCQTHRDKQDKYDIVKYLEAQGVETYEGDLMNDRRWYIDKKVEISDHYRRLYFDIETDDSKEKIEIGKERIVSWAAIDEKGKKFFGKLEEFTDEAETKLLIDFLKLIRKYDLLLGWNSSEFDIPYLKARMRLYDLHKTRYYCWKNLAHFDLLKRFRHIFRFDSHLRSFSLDFISNHFLGRGKIEHKESIIDLWKNNPEKLEAYNIEDSVLVKELDDKLGVSNMMIRQSQWCGVPVGQFGLYSIIDAHIMKTAHRVGQFCRTSLRAIEERRPQNERGNVNPDDTSSTGAKYMGAIVLDPAIGKYGVVHTFDFKGLYPSMMRTSNIGYDTLRYEANDPDLIINPGTRAHLRKTGEIRPTYFDKRPSVINLAISELITKRSEYKKMKLQMIEDRKNKGPLWERIVSDEIIVKELANSTYGIMGLEYGRYFSVDVAESITLFGHWCIYFAKKFFEDRGFPVIYGDTDSVFVATGEKEFDIQGQLDLFHKKLKEELKKNYNIDEVFIELAFDKKYESLILIEKKTYVGHVTNMEGKKTDETYARGLDYIKKNTFSYASEKQKSLIEYILHGSLSKADIQKWMLETKEDFDKHSFSKEELRLTQKVGKELEEYAGTAPLHVRLAKVLKEKTGRNLRNMEIEYIVTGHAKNQMGVLYDDYAGEFDRDYYWENKTQPLLDRVANVVYPGVEWFSYQPNLFDI